MDFLIGVAVIAVLVWVWARKRRQTSGRPYTSSGLGHVSQFRADIDRAIQLDYGNAGVAPDLRTVRRSTGDHLPPRPSGAGGEAWSPRTQQLEVAGEWYRAESLRELFSRHATLSPSGAELRLPATLVPDGRNPHDSAAVAVFVDGLHVGYMERADAKRYHRAIADLPGGELVVTSRQWVRAVDDETWARVTLSVPLPDHLQCPNPFDDGCVCLPPGSTVQVTKEELFMEHLVDLLDKYGSDVVVAASLRSITEQRARSSVELVAVDIDGQQVGVLTPTQTANFLPLVKRAQAEGRGIHCRASLRGNTLKADVALHARKAHELDETELNKVFARL